MSEFETSTESIDFSSSEEVHPNVDEKSFKNYKRQVKLQERKKLKERLNFLNHKETLNEEETLELNNLEKSLKPAFKLKNEDSFRTSDPNHGKIEDSEDILYKIIENPDLKYFSTVVSKNNINFEELEELILYNLSESIKEDNDEVGLLFSKLSLLLGYFRSHGERMLDKLVDELKIPEKKQTFIDDVKKYYLEAKKAIIKLRDEK